MIFKTITGKPECNSGRAQRAGGRNTRDQSTTELPTPPTTRHIHSPYNTHSDTSCCLRQYRITSDTTHFLSSNPTCAFRVFRAFRGRKKFAVYLATSSSRLQCFQRLTPYLAILHPFQQLAGSIDCNRRFPHRQSFQLRHLQQVRYRCIRNVSPIQT